MDDKVGVIGIMEAAERLLSEGYKPERTIYLSFGHDEEVGGKGAQAVAAYIESRGERLAFLLDEGGFVTKGLIDGVDGRVAMIGPAEKGYVSLKLTAKARGGHSSMPPQHTAVGQIAAAIYKIERNPAKADLSFTSDTIKYLGNDAPIEQRVVFANLWLFKPLAE
jgi:carboxypeptidase PM20D1